MIVIIDSGVGNIQSAANAFEHVGADFKITTSSQDLKKADKIVFPGVGAFCDGMKAITGSGLLETLIDQVLGKGKLYLGICLGMQLLATTGLEDGEFAGLNWIPGVVRLLNVKGTNNKLPHIGWNNVKPNKQAQLFANLSPDPTFYFVHSYVLDPKDSSVIAATCEYGEDLVASIHYKNIYGVQFHPEKSQKNGLQLLRNFVRMKS